jgi:FMN phosphatase YigB (HAD superfamily)
MEKKRFIFDLDRTLLTCNYRLVETAIFEPIFGEDTEYLMKNIGFLLDEYESTHPYYDDEWLSEFLTDASGLRFTPEIIDRWNHTMVSDTDVMEEGVIELLDYLKSKDKSLVVLTNWYSIAQIGRLKTAGLYDYFDDVFTGEYQLKPHTDAYMTAMGDYAPEECLVIGDNIIKDYIGPTLNGIDAVLYDKDGIHNDEYIKVKRLTDLIKRY